MHACSRLTHPHVEDQVSKLDLLHIEAHRGDGVDLLLQLQAEQDRCTRPHNRHTNRQTQHNKERETRSQLVFPAASSPNSKIRQPLRLGLQQDEPMSPRFQPRVVVSAKLAYNEPFY